MISGFSDVEADLLFALRNPAQFTVIDASYGRNDALLACAEAHGVAPLLAARFANEPSSPFPERLRASVRSHAAWELGHRTVVRDALAVLAAAGIEPVLFKGTALAYSIYASPVLRTRGDTDMIVPPDAEDRVTRALLGCGFHTPGVAEFGKVTYQTSFRRSGPDGLHELDVHWKINNFEVLSRLFSYQELRTEAANLSALAPGALAASAVHALLLACMHRACNRHYPYFVAGAPRFGGNRLIWLYDLHLLAESFGEHEWRSFVARAESKGLLGICADGLIAARECFATTVPDSVFTALGRPRSAEPASEFLDASPWMQEWLTFQAQPGLRRKVRHLREVVFPPADYIRSKFGGERRQWLPWLYVRRALGGAWRRLRGRMA